VYLAKTRWIWCKDHICCSDGRAANIGTIRSFWFSWGNCGSFLLISLSTDSISFCPVRNTSISPGPSSKWIYKIKDIYEFKFKQQLYELYFPFIMTTISMNQKYHNQERIEQDDHAILKLLIQKMHTQKQCTKTNALFGIQKSLSKNKIKVKSHYIEIHALNKPKSGILLSRKHLNNLSLQCEY